MFSFNTNENSSFSLSNSCSPETGNKFFIVFVSYLNIGGNLHLVLILLLKHNRVIAVVKLNA